MVSELQGNRGAFLLVFLNGSVGVRSAMTAMLVGSGLSKIRLVKKAYISAQNLLASPGLKRFEMHPEPPAGFPR